MTPLRLILAEPFWDDIKPGDVLDVNATLDSVGVMDDATEGGKPGIFIRINTDNGPIIVSTTARLFCVAARGIEAKYPDLFEE